MRLHASLSALLLLAGACGGSRPATPAVASAAPSARYVFTLHGDLAADSVRGARYRWRDIDRELASRGFEVVAEPRSAGADAGARADTIATRVRKLLADGVPAERITVAGIQQGGRIALLVASRVTEPGINYVVMAGCPRRASAEEVRAIGRVQGRILSMYGEDDRQHGSCQRVFEQSPGPLAVREVILAFGDATTFHQPRRSWMNRLEAWAREARAPLMVAPGQGRA